MFLNSSIFCIISKNFCQKLYIYRNYRTDIIFNLTFLIKEYIKIFIKNILV